MKRLVSLIVLLFVSGLVVEISNADPEYLATPSEKRPVCEAPPEPTGNVSISVKSDLEDLSLVDPKKCEIRFVMQGGISVIRANIGRDPLVFTAGNLIVGTYTVSVTFDVDSSNPPGGPGDYIGIVALFVKPGNNSAKEIRLQKLIHLLDPCDNQEVQKSVPVFYDNLNFSWEPVHPEVVYHLSVAQIGVPFYKNHSTRDTTASFSLDSGEFIIGMDAYLNHRQVGTLRHLFSSTNPPGVTGGENQERYGFQFKIQPAENVLSKCQGILSFPGQIGSSALDLPPVFSFFEAITRKKVVLDCRSEGDRFTLNRIPPGSYQLQVEIDENRENPPGYPGDLCGQSFFSCPQKTIRPLKVDLMRVIRLLEPEDTDSTLPVIQAPVVVRNSNPTTEKGMVPFTFRWEPLGKGIEYRYYVIPTIHYGRTFDNQITVNVAPNVRYCFLLNAFSGDIPVGRLFTNGNTDREGYLFFPVKPEEDDPEKPSR